MKRKYRFKVNLRDHDLKDVDDEDTINTVGVLEAATTVEKVLGRRREIKTKAGDTLIITRLSEEVKK